MNCRRCGTILPNGIVICPKCGENNKAVDINQGNLSVNDLMNINNNDNGVKLDFVNDNKNIGNDAFNSYNNDNNFQYDKSMFNNGKQRRGIKINPKVLIALGMVIAFCLGMYLIFENEFKKDNLEGPGVIESSGQKEIDPDDPSTDPTNPDYYKVGDPDDPENPDDPDEPDNPDNPDVPDEPDYGGNGPAAPIDPKDDGSKKTVVYKDVEFEIPFRCISFVKNDVDMIYITNEILYIEFSISDGVLDDMVYDVNSMVNKMNEFSNNDYQEHKDHYKGMEQDVFSYDKEQNVGKYTFYLFNTGDPYRKVFMVKFNDHYYYQGVLQISGNVTFVEGLKYIRDIIKTANDLGSKDEVEEDSYVYNPHFLLYDISNYEALRDEEE